LWKLIGARNAKIRLRCFNAPNRLPEVIILIECGSDETLQRFVSKNLPPFQIRQ
jgi:hypothetical protein